MQQGGDQGRQDDLPQRHLKVLDHDERGGAHDRRGDLTAGGRRRFHRPGKMRPVADALHHRNGQGAGRHGVGDRRAGNHAEAGGRHHSDLGRSAGKAAGDPGGNVDEQLAEADPLGQFAEQHEQEDVFGHHADRDAVDPLVSHVEVVDQPGPGSARMRQHAGKLAAEQGIGHEQHRDGRQGPADRPPCRLQDQDQQQAAHDDVERRRVADPAGHLVGREQGQVEGGRGRGDGQQPVGQRDAAQQQRAASDIPAVAAPGRGVDEVGDGQDEGQEDAAKQPFAHHAGPGRVVVEDRPRDQESGDGPAGPSVDRAEQHLAIEPLFDLAQTVVVEAAFRLSHGAYAIVLIGMGMRWVPRGASADRPTRPANQPVTGSSRRRGKTARRRDAAGCRCRPARLPGSPSSPWRARRREAGGCCRSTTPR